MYEMSTGKKPFTGKNSLLTLDGAQHYKSVSSGLIDPKVPVELEDIIGKAMEKVPQRAVPECYADEGGSAAAKA